jgi:hypothetical protein
LRTITGYVRDVEVYHRVRSIAAPTPHEPFVRAALREIGEVRAREHAPAPNSWRREPLWPAAVEKLARTAEVDKCARASVTIAYLAMMRLSEIRPTKAGHVVERSQV